MTSEYERRVAILESLRAGRKPKEIISWFHYKKTQVYEIAKRYNETIDKEKCSANRKCHRRRSDCKRNDDFLEILKEKVNEDGGQKMSKLAKEMEVSRSTVSVAINHDLCYKSYVFRKRQLLTEKDKLNRKLKAHALLNDIKHESAGFIRFFSDEKIFFQDQKVNRQNDRWICQNAYDVPAIMHSKFPASVMVLGVISSEGDVMVPHFFERHLKVNADIYINVLETFVKPWMDEVAAGRQYVFQQDSAPAHKARKTQAWLYANLPYHWSPDLYPTSSPDCNPLDYYLWGVVESQVNAKPHSTIKSLQDAVKEVMSNLDMEEVKRACSSFRSRLEKVVAVDGDHIE